MVSEISRLFSHENPKERASQFSLEGNGSCFGQGVLHTPKNSNIWHPAHDTE